MAEAGDNIGDGAGADINADDMEKVNKVIRVIVCFFLFTWIFKKTFVRVSIFHKHCLRRL